MPDGREYVVETIEDMALIPEEALPRFLAELPAMLDVVRQAREFNEMHGQRILIRGKMSWIDDGKIGGELTLKITGKSDASPNGRAP